MKKFATYVLVVTMIFVLSACGNDKPQQNDRYLQSSAPSAVLETSEDTASEDAIIPAESSISEAGITPETEELSGASNILVTYFSMPETTNPDNMTQDEDQSVVVIDGEVLGNTQYVAYLIQENTGGDIYRIEPQTPYPTDHGTLVDLAKREQDAAARPKLLTDIENIESYDIIFVGYPNWWGDMPMILYTFLESYDLSGKTIVPFNTHGGSGFSNTIATIAALQPNAAVEPNGYSVSRNSVASAEDDVITWLNELQY